MLISHRDLTNKFEVLTVCSINTSMYEHVGLYFNRKIQNNLEHVCILSCATEYCIADKTIIIDFIEMIMPHIHSITENDIGEYDVMFDLPEEIHLYWKIKHG